MSRKGKKKSRKNKAEKIVLATTIIQLIIQLIDLIKKLFD